MARKNSSVRKDCERFAVMDPAGTEPGAGRRPCYTVIQVWDITPAGDMLLVHQYRRQVQAAAAAEAAIAISREFDVAYIAIEKDGMGLGVVQQVRNSGIAVRAIKARGCKEARSQTAEIPHGQRPDLFSPWRGVFVRVGEGIAFVPEVGLCGPGGCLIARRDVGAEAQPPVFRRKLRIGSREAEMAAAEAEEAMYA